MSNIKHFIIMIICIINIGNHWIFPVIFGTILIGYLIDIYGFVRNIKKRECIPWLPMKARKPYIILTLISAITSIAFIIAGYLPIQKFEDVRLSTQNTLNVLEMDVNADFISAAEIISPRFVSEFLKAGSDTVELSLELSDVISGYADTPESVNHVKLVRTVCEYQEKAFLIQSGIKDSIREATIVIILGIVSKITALLANGIRHKERKKMLLNNLIDETNQS